MPATGSSSPPRPRRQIAWAGTITSCDHCGARVEDIGRSLFNCAGCKIAKYCSATCQKTAWKVGGHKKKCKRLNEDRQWCGELNKILERDEVANAALGREGRASTWTLNNSPNLLLIALLACNYDVSLMQQYHVSIFLKCVVDELPADDPLFHSYYHVLPNARRSDAREFYVDEVELVPKAEIEAQYAGLSWGGGDVQVDPANPASSDHICGIYVHHIGGRAQQFQITNSTLRLKAPPMLTLDELITYSNRGLSYFFFSFGPHEDPRAAPRREVVTQMALRYMTLHTRRTFAWEWGTIDKDGNEQPLLRLDATGRVLPNGPVLSESEKDAKSASRRNTSKNGGMDEHSESFTQCLRLMKERGFQFPPTSEGTSRPKNKREVMRNRLSEEFAKRL